MLFAKLLHRAVRIGTLIVIDADGRRHAFEGSSPGPSVTVKLHDRVLHRDLYLNPDLRLGEAYMDGTLTIEEGTLVDFANLVTANEDAALQDPLYGARLRLSPLLRMIQQYNPVGRSQRNVKHHYDLPDRLYDLFLDDDRQYSCAYFREPTDSLETAQLNKKRHLAAKLLIEPGQKVLDIGSGWGGMALHLAREDGARVTGITLSKNQLDLSRARARAEGLDGAVSFEFRDYREQTGTFDRIVSVGMFEHVGVRHYDEFFRTVERLLDDDGVCVLHSIGRRDRPTETSAWTRKYIFPGGYTPALSEVLPAVERSGLWPTDIEILRLHYAETLKHWRQRFAANREEVKSFSDERFCRMWEFYLAFSEAAFRVGPLMVFQLQLAKRRDAVPLSRDYIAEREREHLADKTAQKRQKRAGHAA